MKMLKIMIQKISILLLMTNLCACVSNKFSPESDQLIAVSDCSEFSGHYVLQDLQEEDNVLSRLFGIKDQFEKVFIDVRETEVEISAFTKSEQRYSRVISRIRSTCSKSILTLITKDKSSANGVVMAAEDQKLQLFSPGLGLLSMRLVSSGIYAFYIIPFYLSSDKILNLKRVK